MFGIFEYARFVMVRQLLENAAREGGRFAVVHTHDKVTADVQAVVRQRLGGQEKQLEGFDPATDIQVFKASPADPTVPASNPDWKTANFGDAITVQISGTYKPNLPTFLFLPAEVPLLVRTVMFSEDTPLTR
jgi:Flp pilus assembly protein TadG